jgi:hypothetical protein
MQRYMIVEHPKSQEALCIEEGCLKGQLPIHKHLQNYHWTRLDDTHVLVLGNYSVQHHDTLHNHDKCTVLQHTGSARTIMQHV